MASLRLQAGSAHVEEGGKVDVEGGCVKLYDRNLKLVLAQYLRPGEIVRITEKGEYVVEL